MVAHLVYVTAANRAAALKIARVIVENRLAACANVLDGATSVYWWDGKLTEESEAVLIAKTTSDMTSALIAKIMEIHDYSCPCVVTLPIAEGNPDFLRWVADQVKSPEA